jgi:AcrR family transcriptional regulator
MNDESMNDLASRARPYHHGDLRNGLLDAARNILEEEDLSQLTLRAVARKAGVSHAAPYRHFPNHEALLVELSLEGFRELREMVAEAARAPGPESDRTANIGSAYMRFVARRPAVARLMFGGQLPNREKFPALGEAADAVGAEISNALPDPALGMAVWSAVHGLAMLVLENVIDLGQRRSGLSVLPSRVEILLRSLFTTPRD